MNKVALVDLDRNLHWTHNRSTFAATANEDVIIIKIMSLGDLIELAIN